MTPPFQTGGEERRQRSGGAAARPQECTEFLKRKWTEMSYEQKLDPKYSISAPYWHAVVDKEYEARRSARREPTPELSATDNERDSEDSDANNNNDDDPELPDLPLQPSASWAAASLSSKKGVAQAEEASHQTPRR